LSILIDSENAEEIFDLFCKAFFKAFGFLHHNGYSNSEPIPNSSAIHAALVCIASDCPDVGRRVLSGAFIDSVGDHIVKEAREKFGVDVASIIEAKIQKRCAIIPNGCHNASA
jgi:hypothetical protein